MSRTTERAGKLNQASTILSSLRKIRRCGARTSTFQPFLRPWDLRSQTALLASEFPNKTMSYALIQEGFPLVSNSGAYEKSDGTSSGGPLPGGRQMSVSQRQLRRKA